MSKDHTHAGPRGTGALTPRRWRRGGVSLSIAMMIFASGLLSGPASANENLARSGFVFPARMEMGVGDCDSNEYEVWANFSEKSGYYPSGVQVPRNLNDLERVPVERTLMTRGAGWPASGYLSICGLSRGTCFALAAFEGIGILGTIYGLYRMELSLLSPGGVYDLPSPYAWMAPRTTFALTGRYENVATAATGVVTIVVTTERDLCFGGEGIANQHIAFALVPDLVPD